MSGKKPGVTELVNRLVGDAEHVQVDDRLASGAVDHIDHPRQERLDRVAGNDDRTRPNAGGLGGVAEKRSHVAGLVDLVRVGRKGDGDVVSLGHDFLLTQCGLALTAPRTAISRWACSSG